MMVSQEQKNWGFVWENSPQKARLLEELASPSLVPRFARPFSFDEMQATTTITQFRILFMRAM